MSTPTSLDLRLGSWAQLGTDASALRLAVFVQEQGIDPALELDEQDAHCLHAVAYHQGRPVATGRLLPSEQGRSRIGRMAVAQTQRGQGWGRQILLALVQAAQARGDRCVSLHAQCSAQGFYQSAGFSPVGERFIEADIEHIDMQLSLQP